MLEKQVGKASGTGLRKRSQPEPVKERDSICQRVVGG
jgi:hypothetical protein